MLLPYAMYNGSTDQKVTSLIADRNASLLYKNKKKIFRLPKKKELAIPIINGVDEESI
jgi:hypothetical protein